MDNKEKVVSLFKYIKEIYSLKYNVIKNINSQDWHFFIEDIPDDKENIRFNYLDKSSSEEFEQSENIILNIKKPEFENAPQLPISLKNWVVVGWEKFMNDVNIIKYNEKNKEEFEDNKDRIKDLNEWIDERNKWVERQIKIQKTRKFFDELYSKYIVLERDSEIIEFMVGQGIITENEENSQIYHPILMKRLKIEYESENNIIKIKDINQDSEIYTMLLQEFDYINYNAVKLLVEQNLKKCHHPLDRIETITFLKSFIHMLHSDSKFIENSKDKITTYDKILMYSKPVFFIRKRISGVIRAIDEIITHIERNNIVESPLLELIGQNSKKQYDSNENIEFEHKLSLLNGEDDKIMFCKETNLEQLEIAKRIENYNAVLVQGPPGTGKTHTIANLIGHFLADGKNILVTSHTKKALNVLKDMVPKEIQSLCVTAIDDSNKDMLESIDTITEKISSHTSFEFLDKVTYLQEKRNNLLKEIHDIRKDIIDIKFKEYEPIKWLENIYSVKEASEFISKNSHLSYIHGDIKFNTPLPVTDEELKFLYKSNEDIKKEEEFEMGFNLPILELNPKDFSEDIKRLKNIEEDIKSILDPIRNEYKLEYTDYELKINKENISNELDTKNLIKLKEYINKIGEMEDWHLYVIQDGIRGGSYKDLWFNLIDMVKQTASIAEHFTGLVNGKKIYINSNLKEKELKLKVENIKNHIVAKKKISKFNLIFHKSWLNILKSITINDLKISSKEDCDLVIKYIELEDRRQELKNSWDQLVASHGGPKYENFGQEPERGCLSKVYKIENYLNKGRIIFQEAYELAKNSGIYISFFNKEFNQEIDELKYKKQIVFEFFPIIINVLQKNNEAKSINKKILELYKQFSNPEYKNSVLCSQLLKSFDDKDSTIYEEQFEKLHMLHKKYHILEKRNRIIEKIKPFAPHWAECIKDRSGIHGNPYVPKDIDIAWKKRQLEYAIYKIVSKPYEQLLQRNILLNEELREVTCSLTENLAWYKILKNVESDSEKRQALQGWKLTVKKIGKGTGKNSFKLKKEAQKLMGRCQRAVPAWIMTLNKALESLNPETNKFDVVIIDEASQSDISALAIMYLAKKIIIVGDDEQVSPSVVGMELNKVNTLSSIYIKDLIPNWHIYDLKTSLYDIAKTTFQGLMLKEHFRCVPDIIGYSNKLSYEYKIKPLRSKNSTNITPATIVFKINGHREKNKKVNYEEAKGVVALMLACMKQPEYDNMTFGAISMLGDEQAKLISDICLKHMDPKEFEKRKILCGNSSHFQGDERDIIFMSLVDSNESDTSLRIIGAGSEKSIKQRYNVAASRAKNQLWIVHSLDVKKDLKDGDIRKDLIDYATNPSNFMEDDIIENTIKSKFVEEISENLRSNGYNIQNYFEVGAYTVEIAVTSNGRTVFIECDGEHLKTKFEIRDNIEKQIVLERLGWKFIRVRSSEYYLNPNKTMQNIYKELRSYNIVSEKSNISITNTSTSYELFKKVKIYAMQMLEEWESESKEYYELEYNKNENDESLELESDENSNLKVNGKNITLVDVFNKYSALKNAKSIYNSDKKQIIIKSLKSKN